MWHVRAPHPLSEQLGVYWKTSFDKLRSDFMGVINDEGYRTALDDSVEGVASKATR